jgi:ADP-ribose pyrophosphatase YjhB (NUDIX family)
VPDPELRYCPCCAGPLEWRPFEYADITHPVCTSCGFVVWQNRKPSVEALIFRGQGQVAEILLGRSKRDGRWNLPGGFVNAADEPEAALVRECKREMDITINVGAIFGAYPDLFHGIPILSIVYLCRVIAGEPRAADLIDAVGWFPVREPPPLSFPADEAAIREFQRAVG